MHMALLNADSIIKAKYQVVMMRWHSTSDATLLPAGHHRIFQCGYCIQCLPLPTNSHQQNALQAPWLLMIETDYVWLKPPRAPPAEDWRVPSWAFPFTYIVPQAPALAGVLRKMYSEAQGPLSDVPGSGPAPVMLRVHELFKVGTRLSHGACPLCWHQSRLGRGVCRSCGGPVLWSCIPPLLQGVSGPKQLSDADNASVSVRKQEQCSAVSPLPICRRRTAIVQLAYGCLTACMHVSDIWSKMDRWTELAPGTLQVVPDWERLTAHIEADKESKDRLGWVREMYAFSVAAALQVPGAAVVHACASSLQATSIRLRHSSWWLCLCIHYQRRITCSHRGWRTA